MFERVLCLFRKVHKIKQMLLLLLINLLTGSTLNLYDESVAYLEPSQTSTMDLFCENS